MKRNDMQKRGKRMEEMTGMWKNPHERRKNGSWKYRKQNKANTLINSMIKLGYSKKNHYL